MKFYLDTILEPIDSITLTEGLAKTIDLNFTQDFVIQDIGISSRVMNYWNEMGLMPAKPRTENSTYRFNFSELLWFFLVRELREFGYSINNIKDLKEIFFKPLDYTDYFRSITQKEKDKVLKRLNKIKFKDEILKIQFTEVFTNEFENTGKRKLPLSYNLLNIFINSFIFYRDEIKLLIDVRGNLIPLFETEKDETVYEELMNKIDFDRESFISISLTKFFRKFILNQAHFNFIRDNNILNENESHILSLVREGKAKSITIRFKDEKPFMLEVTKERKIHAEARLSEVLLSRGYQDISMKTENGNIVVSNFVTKEKLK
jgi:DNA-binding transcriptional MerR regulator